MPAGGLSTRMGGSSLRLELPIGPVTSRPIIQLQIEKLVAVCERYGTRLPLVVMTSDQVHAETTKLFEQHHYWGLAPEDVRFIVQPSLPVVDDTGDPVVLDHGSVLEAPAGHGSMIAAFESFDVVSWLRQQGTEILFQFQYPNVMEQVCDPVLIGAHISGEFEATVKAFEGTREREEVGRIVRTKSGRLQVVEYHELQGLADCRWMESLPANLGTYIWSLGFVERCIRQDVRLPMMATRHRTATHDGEMWKAEQFVFDLLDYAQAAGFIVVDRDQHYGIVKYPAGSDSLASARRQLNRLYRGWLTAAGAVTEDADVRVEISPLFSLDQEELLGRIEPGFHYCDGLVLSESGL